jgi:uncharacterized protein (DUF488 family)
VLIRTSYFAKYKEADGVSIALKSPEWFKGESYKFLAPSWSILWNFKSSGQTIADEQEYERRFRAEILSKLDPKVIAQGCDGKVLLCYEKSGYFCHRHIVANWLKEELNIDVVEV